MADANQQDQTAAPAPVVRVAQTPAQYTIAQPLDFAQRNDITIYKNGCTPLECSSLNCNSKQTNTTGMHKVCLPMGLPNLIC
jgi:hypothetical protein